MTVRLSKPKSTLEKALKELKIVKKIEIDGGEVLIHIQNASKHIGSLVPILTAQSAGLEELAIRTPSLDDVFMQVTGSHLKEEK